MMIVKDIEYFTLTEQILLAYVVDEEDGDELGGSDEYMSMDDENKVNRVLEEARKKAKQRNRGEKANTAVYS